MKRNPRVVYFALAITLGLGIAYCATSFISGRTVARVLPMYLNTRFGGFAGSVNQPTQFYVTYGSDTIARVVKTAKIPRDLSDLDTIDLYFADVISGYETTVAQNNHIADFYINPNRYPAIRLIPANDTSGKTNYGILTFLHTRTQIPVYIDTTPE